MAASNLTIRLTTAAVAIPLMLALLYYGPAWGWLLFLMAAAVVAALELFGMTHPGDKVARIGGVVLVWGVILGLWFGLNRPAILFTMIVAMPFASLLLTLWRLGDIKTAALRVAGGTFGPLWVGVGLGSIALLRVEGGDEGAGFVVFSLGLAWLADTGGYFAGRFLGKHKLYPKVSPAKTVEGAIGGVVATILGSLAIRLVFVPSLSIRDTVLLGAVGSVFGMLGDLGESLLKRSIGVKDSGAIVPGHGGVLDRIDAVVVTAPLTLLYLVWFR